MWLEISRLLQGLECYEDIHMKAYDKYDKYVEYWRDLEIMG